MGPSTVEYDRLEGILPYLEGGIFHEYEESIWRCAFAGPFDKLMLVYPGSRLTDLVSKPSSSS